MRDGRAALLCVVVAGCSYDWSTGGADASPDALTDVGADIPVAQDAAAEADAPGADAAGDAVVDVTEEPPTCAQLLAAVEQAFAAAIVCQSGAEACLTTVLNQCGCTVVVESPDMNGSPTVAYEAAVKQLQMNTSCPLGCSGTCDSMPQTGLCVVSEAGASTLACSQL